MNWSLKATAAIMLVMVFAVGCNKPDEPNNGGNNDLPEEPVVGLFSINDSTQVCFSPGNLQYQASTNTWRFAEHQWDYIGEGNANISETYDGWIDLFAWGTGDHPTDTSTYMEHVVYANFVDWGVNPISNWNGDECQWCTLDMLEWLYLLFRRKTDSGVSFVTATVNDVDGVILLPDDWDASIFGFVDINNQVNESEENIISMQEWEQLERKGAVFLPNAGIRLGTEVKWVQDYGLYWIAGPSDPFAYVYYVQCAGDIVTTPNYCPRYAGLSVRLVRDAE